MKILLICAVLGIALSSDCDLRSLSPDDQKVASGGCKAVRKERGSVRWQCSDGSTFWLEAYRHEDKQGDWREPPGCQSGNAAQMNADSTMNHYTEVDARRYRVCPDGQSFWVKE